MESKSPVEDPNKLLSIARKIADVGASVHSSHRDALTVSAKGSPMNLVTNVDQEAERQMVALLTQERPNDGLLGEEGAVKPGTTGYVWVLDPLDGTTNFVYGYGAHSVSVGLEFEGTRVLGVVVDTSRQLTYWGGRTLGAYCDGRLISVNQPKSLAEALLATGFAPSPELRVYQAEILQRLLPQIRDLRRTGSPALDLCHVAAGQTDGFYEFDLSPWDVSAGAAIVEGAAGIVETLPNLTPPGNYTLAGSTSLVQALTSRLRSAAS